MSIMFPKKIELDEQVKEDLHNLEIRVLGASFNWKTGVWGGENQENKAKESKLNMELKKEEMKQRLLMHMLTDKEVKLGRTKKEISEILKKHADLLELQGLPVKNLLSEHETES